MSETTIDPPEFPDSVIRHNFAWDDYKVISGHWTEWNDAARLNFLEMIALTRPSDVVTAVGQFLEDNDPATPPPGPADSDGVSPPDPGPDGTTDPGPKPPGEPGAAAPPVNAKLAEVLATHDTALAYASEHLADVAELIELEENGKARKTVLEDLRRLPKPGAE